MKQTDISTIGETGLIERIRSIVEFRLDDVTLNDNLVVGIGDDTAVYRPSPGKVQLLTTDALVEGIHFDLTFTSMKHLGWKAMVASLSDIASMGGTPRYATLSISLPSKISVEMVAELYEGVTFACRKYSCLVAGGDTTASAANLFVSVSLTGEADESKLLKRSGAKPGDLLCVSGHLGASTAGLKILQREKERYHQSGNAKAFEPRLEIYTVALEKHLMPKPRFDVSSLLTSSCRAHAMIDISDGLASELHRLCEASGVGASIYEHNIPLESVTQKVAAECSESPLAYALYGGEEYELLFAIDDEEFQKLESLTTDVTIIGRMTDPSEGIRLVRENGETEPLPFGGWEHFRKNTHHQ